MEIKGRSGHVPNFVSEQDLLRIIRTLQSFPINPVDGGHCHGVDKNHMAYDWFRVNLLERVSKVFDRDLQLVFGMYLDLREPFGVHSDVRPCDGQPYISCLIPCSVNYQAHLCELATTTVFNEMDNGVGPPENPTFQADYAWSRGDLIWWNTPLFHSSGQFEKFSSKQSIVIHTYV
jgi:hypothetical protein